MSKHKRQKSERGSVLMEFVLVVPVYMAVIGGILWLGMKSLDATSLRSADHWTVWNDGGRFDQRMPAIISLRGMFPRASLVTTSGKRALTDEHAYLQFIGSKTTLFEKRPDFITTWLDMPFTARGEKRPFRPFEFTITSSRYNNNFTQCIVMRSKGSSTAKRHWHSSLVASDNIWKFSTKADEYPKEWKLDLLKEPKYKDDTKKMDKEPKKHDFYDRFGKYEEWSVPD